MSILDLHGADIQAAASRFVAPTKPEPKFSAWNLATAVPRGFGEAAAQVMATGVELATMDGSKPGRRIDLQNDFADSLRDRGREFRPDPETASTAEQVLYGFARGATKIVAGAMLAGPAGVVAAGVEEGISQADDMKREGVDAETRAKAGLVQGGGLALAALPIVGTSLKATAGLYLAGGPGGFMAQQALTREILSNAGNEKLAASYDPFDPVGLAVASLVPAVFAGVGIRNQRRTAAAKAADDFNAGPVPSDMTATATAAREAFAPEVVDAARVAYAVERRAAGNLGADTTRTADAHETALARAEAQVARGDPVQVADLAPFISAAERESNFKAWFGGSKVVDEAGKPLVVYHGTAADFDVFAPGDGSASESMTGRLGNWFSTSPELAGRWAFGPGAAAGGRVVPTYLAMTNPMSVPASVLRKAIEDGPKAETAIVQRLTAEAQRGGHDGIRVVGEGDGDGSAWAKEWARDSFIAFDPKQVKSAIGNSGRFDPNSASLTDPLTNLADALGQVRRAMSPETDAAALRMAQDLGAAIDKATTDPAVASRLYRSEAARLRKTAEAAQTPDIAARTSTAADMLALKADSLPRLNPAETAEAGAMAARIAQIEADYPGLMVRMDGDEAARPLSQFLADAQREADEMLADAQLMEVAAQCAILNGTG